MTLSTEHRAEINRHNASHSTGPKTDEGKDRSRRNALKHGLRADALALPNEDPELVAERCRAWNDYYQPQSPAAQHLVNECVQATLLSERCHRFHAAALADQIRRAEYDWDCDRQDQVEALAALLATEPTQLWIDWLFEPQRLPDACRSLARAADRPDRAACQAALRSLVAERLAMLRALESELRSSFAGPERAAAADRALLLRDEAAARRFLRYHAEARTAFTCYHGQLQNALAEVPSPAPAAVAEAPAPAPAAVSPNEANPDGSGDISHHESETSGTGSGGGAVPSGGGFGAEGGVIADAMSFAGAGGPIGAVLGGLEGSFGAS
jgi:hypothetical protein